MSNSSIVPSFPPWHDLEELTGWHSGSLPALQTSSLTPSDRFPPRDRRERTSVYHAFPDYLWTPFSGWVICCAELHLTWKTQRLERWNSLRTQIARAPFGSNAGNTCCRKGSTGNSQFPLISNSVFETDRNYVLQHCFPLRGTFWHQRTAAKQVE